MDPCHPSQIAGVVGNPGHRLLQASVRGPYHISSGERDWIHQELLGYHSPSIQGAAHWMGDCWEELKLEGQPPVN